MTPPPTAPRIGAALAAISSETTTPKRDAIWATNRAIAGAPSRTAAAVTGDEHPDNDGDGSDECGFGVQQSRSETEHPCRNRVDRRVGRPVVAGWQGPPVQQDVAFADCLTDEDRRRLVRSACRDMDRCRIEQHDETRNSCDAGRDDPDEPERSARRVP